MNDPLQIAIDGPVASGKGEIAARIARKFHLLYIYTGAMYRALALACIERGIAFNNEPKIMELLKDTTIDMVSSDESSAYPYKVLLNGKDVTERIIQPDTAKGSSDVGVLPQVRRWMVARQQELAKGSRVVMEGRDIALRVLPQADLKIYLTASVEERAKRRFIQWQDKQIAKTFKQTLQDTKERDRQDSTRDVDPLQKTADAWEIDTTHMKPEEVIEIISHELSKRGLV